MIFNGIKLSAARKKIAQLVEEQTEEYFPGPAKSMGIIIDTKNEDAFEALNKINTLLSIPVSKTKIFFNSQNKVKPPAIDGIVFNLQDFDTRAEIINQELLEISSKRVDLLITFAGEKNTVAHLLTAHIKAGIKVGRFQQNAALYDLILQTEEDADLFVKELLKYLKNLKKGSNE